MNSIKREMIDSRIDMLTTDGLEPTRVIRSHRAKPDPVKRHRRSVAAGLVFAAVVTLIPVGASAPEVHHAAPVAIAEPRSPEVAPPSDPTGSTTTDNPDPDYRKTEHVTRAERQMPRVEIAIAFALAQVGKPYRWAQAGPYGFDCSGLVLAAFKQIGLDLPHYTGTMIGYGVRVTRSDLRRGDIIFPSSHHVVIYLGDGMQVAASSGSHRVVIQPVYAIYAIRRLV